MVKRSQPVDLNNFQRGLITEANPLSPPVGSTKIEQNFTINNDGSRDRRLGIDFEENFIQNDVTDSVFSLRDRYSYGTYFWKSAGGIPLLDIAVVQVGPIIQLYRATEPFSQNLLQEFNLSEDSSEDVTIGSDIEFSFASINGFLVIATGSGNVVYIKTTGNVETPIFEKLSFRLRVRDRFGLDVIIDDEDLRLDNNVSLNPETINEAHYYNLRNQSWGVPRKNSAGNFIDPITEYFDNTSTGDKYPSNAQNVWSALRVEGDTTASEIFHPEWMESVLNGNTEAGRGYFIIDALNRGQSREQEYLRNQTKYQIQLTGDVTNLNEDRTIRGAVAVKEYAGRVWYSGFGAEVEEPDNHSPDLNSYVLFSRVVDSEEDLGACYQVADPTYGPDPDIVATDGGFIRIAEAETILGLETAGDSLFIFAQNGVWQVNGNDRGGFSADGFNVTKVSSFGVRQAGSIVQAEETVYYWGDGGIYAITPNENSVYIQVDISKDTILSYFNTITKNRIALNISSGYNPSTKTVSWYWSSGFKFNEGYESGQLNYITTLQSFSPDVFPTIGNQTPHIVGLLPSQTTEIATEQFNVVVEGEQVTVNGDNVVVGFDFIADREQIFKYPVITREFDPIEGSSLQVTFAEYRNTKFLDWEQLDGVGVDAEGQLVFSDFTGGTVALEKQTPYLFLVFERTETGFTEDEEGNLFPINPSSCLLQSRWDWHNSSAGGKWSRERQAYKYRKLYIPSGVDDPYDTGQSLIFTRNKLRGRGKAVSVSLRTEPGKDCRLQGWSMLVNANKVG